MTTSLQRSLNRVIAVLGTALVVATGVTFAAYGGQDERGAAPNPAAPAAAVDEVDIKDFKFVPEAIAVKAGTTITWTNSDAAPHTASSGSSPLPDGVFDTGILKTDQSKRIKVTKPGTFAYYCELHAFMKGTVTVT